MTKRGWRDLTVCGLLIVAGGLASGCASDGPAPSPPTEEEMMAAWQAYMTPGDEHAAMAAQAGDWTASSKMWHTPDAPPEESTATVRFSMILGGRYQVQEWSGTAMGMPFEGHNILSFDNASGEFTSMWVDSMGTGMFVSKGRRAADGTLTLRGGMSDGMGNTMPTRTVLTDRADGSVHMVMYAENPMAGPGESKMMEMVSTRSAP